MDYAHKQTDKLLQQLEKSVAAVYKTVGAEIQKQMTDFLNEFIDEDNKKKKQVEKGTLTETEYKAWRKRKIEKAKEYTEVIKKAAETANNANTAAQEIVNNNLPKIYALNQNFMNYTFEVAGGFKLGFVNEQTIIRLLRDNPDLFPAYKLDKLKDINWNTQKIREIISAGLLQGKPMPGIAKDLMRVANMNEKSALLHAQTSVTGAENAGRQAGFKQAKEMGINFKRIWIATLDSRTRDSHRRLDGQMRDIDEPFDSPLGKIMYPGDTSAAPGNVWRCRCSLGVRVRGASAGQRRENTGSKNVINYKSYKEWEHEQNKEDTLKYIFSPAQTIEDAEKYAKENIFSGYLGAKTSFSGIDLSVANQINKELEAVSRRYNKKMAGLQFVNPKTAKGLKQLGGNEDALFATNPLTGALFANKNILKNEKLLNQYNSNAQKAFEFVLKNKDKLTGEQLKLAELYEKAGKSVVNNTIEGFVVHEFGHYLATEINPNKETLQKIKENMNKYLISGYSQNNISEYLAESFVEFTLGDKNKIDPLVRKIFEEAKVNE